MLDAQETRRIAELKAGTAHLPKGLKAAFLRITGRYRDLVREAEAAAQAAKQRDRDEQQRLIERHLAERRELIRELRQAGVEEAFRSVVAQDPRQVLHLRPEDLVLSQDQLLRNPALILAEISKTKARFDRADILRALARRIDDPLALSAAADKALKSAELIRLEGEGTPQFTTRDYRVAEEKLRISAQTMATTGGFGVAARHITHAKQAQDAKMHRAFGGQLSEEQRAALDHILSDRQFACIHGLAGAGKSTLLATAMEAWRRQGITVHGAALAEAGIPQISHQGSLTIPDPTLIPMFASKPCATAKASQSMIAWFSQRSIAEPCAGSQRWRCGTTGTTSQYRRTR